MSKRETLLKSDSQLSNLNLSWANLVTDEVVESTKAALEKKGHKAFVANSRKEALELLVSLVPEGSSVSAGASTTLEEIGWSDHLQDNASKYEDWIAKARNAPYAESGEIRRKGATADFFLSSVTALTQEGDLTVCDLTGTRVMGFNASKTLIVVVGTNKIVPTYVDAVKRTYDYCLPLESARVRVAYPGVKASAVNNFLAIRSSNPWGPRITVVIVKDLLGF